MLKRDKDKAEKWFRRCASVGCSYSDQEKIEFLTPPPEKKKKHEDLVSKLENVQGKIVWKKNTDYLV